MQKFKITEQNVNDIIGRINKFLRSCEKKPGLVSINYNNAPYSILQSASVMSANIIDFNKFGIVGLYPILYNPHMVEIFDIGTSIYFNGGNSVTIHDNRQNVKIIIKRTKLGKHNGL